MVGPLPYAGARLSEFVTFAILHRNALDCDALESLVSSRVNYRVVGTSTSLDSFILLCERTLPNVSILDACYSLERGDVFVVAAMLKRQAKLHGILFLDDVPNRLRAQRAMAVEGAGYVTRQRSSLEFVSAISGLVEGHVPLDGFSADCLHTERGIEQRLICTSPRLAPLTPREIDVLQLLAQGRSTADCAGILRLAANTIANHKTRLMKKLGVNKTNQLIHIAIREGIIAP